MPNVGQLRGVERRGSGRRGAGLEPRFAARGVFRERELLPIRGWGVCRAVFGCCCRVVVGENIVGKINKIVEACCRGFAFCGRK